MQHHRSAETTQIEYRAATFLRSEALIQLTTCNHRTQSIRQKGLAGRTERGYGEDQLPK